MGVPGLMSLLKQWAISLPLECLSQENEGVTSSSHPPVADDVAGDTRTLHLVFDGQSLLYHLSAKLLVQCGGQVYPNWYWGGNLASLRCLLKAFVAALMELQNVETHIHVVGDSSSPPSKEAKAIKNADQKREALKTTRQFTSLRPAFAENILFAELTRFGKSGRYRGRIHTYFAPVEADMVVTVLADRLRGFAVSNDSDLVIPPGSLRRGMVLLDSLVMEKRRVSRSNVYRHVFKPVRYVTPAAVAEKLGLVSPLLLPALAAVIGNDQTMSATRDLQSRLASRCQKVTQTKHYVQEARSPNPNERPEHHKGGEVRFEGRITSKETGRMGSARPGPSNGIPRSAQRLLDVAQYISWLVRKFDIEMCIPRQSQRLDSGSIINCLRMFFEAFQREIGCSSSQKQILYDASLEYVRLPPPPRPHAESATEFDPFMLAAQGIANEQTIGAACSGYHIFSIHPDDPEAMYSPWDFTRGLRATIYAVLHYVASLRFGIQEMNIFQLDSSHSGTAGNFHPRVHEITFSPNASIRCKKEDVASELPADLQDYVRDVVGATASEEGCIERNLILLLLEDPLSTLAMMRVGMCTDEVANNSRVRLPMKMEQELIQHKRLALAVITCKVLSRFLGSQSAPTDVDQDSLLALLASIADQDRRGGNDESEHAPVLTASHGICGPLRYTPIKSMYTKYQLSYSLLQTLVAVVSMASDVADTIDTSSLDPESETATFVKSVRSIPEKKKEAMKLISEGTLCAMPDGVFIENVFIHFVEHRRRRDGNCHFCYREDKEALRSLLRSPFWMDVFRWCNIHRGAEEKISIL